MKFNYKSRKGFTLIELLVVIGILAVLAAIAIPSVAGLIDRANVSADKTNSNEMTNAIERFASEYELYCQDIASGALDTYNLDSAQGRVYNVTKATTRGDIETLEVAQDALITDDMIAIYRDTKYPVNAKTMQLVVQNYTKTSSSTFEPKQSDMHYWYSPDCGVVVVAEPNKTAAELDGYVISGMDAKGNDISGTDRDAKWIDLTLGVALSGGSSLDMSNVKSNLEENDWATIQAVAKENKTAEAGWSIGDTKTITINGQERTATIIGINHDSENSVTFMIMSNIGSHIMCNSNSNEGGWEMSEMRNWLNNEVYNSMSNKNYIKEVTKMTNNVGKGGIEVTETRDKLFFLSAIETGFSAYNVVDGEGTTYEWFVHNKTGQPLTLRSPTTDSYIYFKTYLGNYLGSCYSDAEVPVSPAFVIG